MDISRILQRQRSVVSVDEAAPGSALKAAMCGWPASADFTPFLCRPVSSVGSCCCHTAYPEAARGFPS